MKKLRGTVTALLAIVLGAGILAGCGTKAADYPTTVAATYGSENIYLDEANFMLRYTQWAQEGYYWDMYEQYFGYTDMWKAPSQNDGQTMGQYLKEMIMAQILQTRILADHAEEYNVTLTDADKETIAQAVTAFREGFAEEFKNYSDADDAKITEWLEKNALAVKVWDAVKMSADVSATEEESQMFTLEYVKVSAHEATEEELEAGTLFNEDLANAVYERLSGGEEFSAFSEELGVTSQTSSYLKVDPENTALLYTNGVVMKTGETQMFQDVENDCWYVVKCTSDLDAEATATKVKEVIDKKREEHFNAIYIMWTESAPAFEVKSCWDDITVGGGKIYVAVTTEAATEAETTEGAGAETTAEPTEATEAETTEETTEATEAETTEETSASNE